MFSLTSNSSKSQCLVCLASFQSKRCKNPEYFTNVFDTLFRLLEIDVNERGIRWNFGQNGIPFCKFCCSAVKKLKELNDQFQLLQQQINNILHTTKQNILKSTSVSNNSSGKNVKHTLINRVHYLPRYQVTRGSSHLDTGNTKQFIKVEIESNNDEANLSYPDSNGEQCKVVKINEKDALSEAENETCHFDSVGVIESTYTVIENNEDPDSLFLDPKDCDSSHQSSSNATSNTIIKASVIQEGNRYETEVIDIKHESSNDFNSDIVDEEECSSQDHVVGDFDPLSLDADDAARVQAPDSESDSREETAREQSTRTKEIQSRPYMNKNHKCDICSKRFERHGHLVSHRRVHTGEKPFRCGGCERNFARLDALVKHASRMHSGTKPYKCDICGTKFGQAKTLVRHTRSHTCEKPFKCEICDKWFKTLDILKRHKLIHSGDQVFKCDFCDKSFTRNYMLIVHRGIHAGEKEWRVSC